MTSCRYPPVPYDWDTEMNLIETRLDDHLTDEEVAARFATLDRMATRGIVPLPALPPVRHGYGRAVLGVIGIVATVCGVGALLYGIS